MFFGLTGAGWIMNHVGSPHFHRISIEIGVNPGDPSNEHWLISLW